MKPVNSVVASILIVLLSACASSPLSLSEDNQSELRGELAILSDYKLNDGFIEIQAVGYGCTFFNSFEVAVANKQDNVMAVIRTRPDECGMKPRNVSLQYSIKHLGLNLNKQINVKNRLTSTARF